MEDKTGNKNMSIIDKKLKISNKLNIKFAFFCFSFGFGYFYYNYYEKRLDLNKKINEEINKELYRLIMKINKK